MAACYIQCLGSSAGIDAHSHYLFRTATAARVGLTSWAAFKEHRPESCDNTDLYRLVMWKVFHSCCVLCEACHTLEPLQNFSIGSSPSRKTITTEVLKGKLH
eukprot:1948134-Amphidinium_carterae.1